MSFQFINPYQRIVDVSWGNSVDLICAVMRVQQTTLPPSSTQTCEPSEDAPVAIGGILLGHTTNYGTGFAFDWVGGDPLFGFASIRPVLGGVLGFTPITVKRSDQTIPAFPAPFTFSAWAYQTPLGNWKSEIDGGSPINIEGVPITSPGENLPFKNSTTIKFIPYVSELSGDIICVRHWTGLGPPSSFGYLNKKIDPFSHRDDLALSVNLAGMSIRFAGNNYVLTGLSEDRYALFVRVPTI
jgi:hypothetical protein